jgi:transposase, IS30 family
MPLIHRREVRREFWLLIRSGLSIPDATAQLGIDPGTGLNWVGQTGGVTPHYVNHPPTGRFLSIDEREVILAGISQGMSIRAIARSINRQPSTVQRELARNMIHRYRPKRADGSVKITGPGKGHRAYRPNVAQRDAEARASRPKRALLAGNERLRDEVQKRLTDKHSPEQISNRLRADFPDDPEMRVSHETIYQSLYVEGRGALKRELVQCLRTGRALRKPRRSSTERRGRIPNMVNIAERPPEVEDRAVIGHWEGDLIVGANSGSAIGTLVERSSGFVMLLHLPDRHGALEVQEAMIPKMSSLPEILRQTLTWDQGVEMSNHVEIAAATDLDIYFCDPHSPWQRGSNENTNGLLRQYFPKSTDLSGYHPDYLEYVANQLNTRPRKRLGWLTPAEALDKLLAKPIDPPSVALTA